MDFSIGKIVQTPDGRLGRISKPTTGTGSPRFLNLDSRADLRVYSLLMESGEVRAVSEDALNEVNKIRGSGSLS